LSRKLTTDAQQALEVILGWSAPIIQPRRMEKILRLANLLALEKSAAEIDRATVIEAAKLVLHSGHTPLFKRLEGPVDPTAVKQTYLSLESYYTATRIAKRWDFKSPKPDKPAGEMKVLAFNASPRKGGNSDSLVDEALHGAADAGASVEKIHLIEVNIKSCASTLIQRDYFVAKKQFPELSLPYCEYALGCEDESHRGRCVLGDDMPAIYPKIAAADAIVLGFPIYNGWEAAALTGFLERWDRYRSCIQNSPASKKRGMLVSTWGYLDTATNDHVMENVITKLNYRGVPVVEVVVACGVVGMLSGLDTDGQAIIRRFPDEMAKAYAAGRTLVTGER
jgi:multimeric flavodoxin WrbA